MNRNITIAAIVAAAALLAGCSGGSSGTSRTPAAQPPQILGLSSVELNQDTSSSSLAFQILDADSPQGTLEIGVASSDPALLPLAGIRIEGTDSSRTIRVTPAPESVGTATVTVTVRDPGGLSSSAALAVRVNPVLVSFRSLTNEAFALAENSDQSKVAGITVQPDADDDARAFDALLQ